MGSEKFKEQRGGGGVARKDHLYGIDDLGHTMFWK